MPRPLIVREAQRLESCRDSCRVFESGDVEGDDSGHARCPQVTGASVPCRIASHPLRTIGASAVYGSDAIAGVVNFKLKDEFEDLRFDGRRGQTDQADGSEYSTGVTAGMSFAYGRGEVFGYVGCTEREAVFQTERRYSAVALGHVGAGEGSTSTSSRARRSTRDCWRVWRCAPLLVHHGPGAAGTVYSTIRLPSAMNSPTGSGSCPVQCRTPAAKIADRFSFMAYTFASRSAISVQRSSSER